MSKDELEKMIIEETRELTKETLKEVLGFIKSKKTKKPQEIIKKSFDRKLVNELTGLNQNSLAHLEEEFEDYKELYPCER